MNCPQCQSPNAPDAAFCGNCGTRLAPAQGAPLAGGYQEPGAGTPLGYGVQSAAPGPVSGPAPGTVGGPGVPGGYDPAVPQPPSYPQGQYQQSGGPYPRRPAGVPPVSFDLNRLTMIDKVVAGATLIAMISIWLPWYSVSFGYLGTFSFSGTGGHGWLWLEFVVALVLLAYLIMRAAWAEPPVSLPVAHAPLLIIGTGLQLLLLLIAFADIPYGSQGVGWGWAAFIGLIAALVAAGPVIVPAVRTYQESRNAGGGPRQFQ